MNSNPYTLKLKLKQHTPLLHFHPHANATIRATEIKPKLDKFLVTKLGGWDKVPDEWITVGNRETDALVKALAYQVQLFCPNPKISYIKNRKTEGGPALPSYFGNTGDKYNDSPKYWSFSKGLLDIKFNTKVATDTKHGRLLEFVGHHIDEFFANQNFGTRQSKGYGSFTIYNSTATPNTHYCFTIDGGPIDDHTRNPALKSIQLLYRTLRSGINEKKFDRGTSTLEDIYYFKSLLFMYLHTEGRNIKWDKRSIREHFYLSHDFYKSVKELRTDQSGTVHASGDNDLMARDILGLSTEQDWMKYGIPKRDSTFQVKTNTKTIGMPDSGADTLTKASVLKNEKKEPLVARYKSPITFKPILFNNDRSYAIYVMFEPIDKFYLGKDFLVSSSKFSNKGPKKLTMWSSFDISDYLDFCFKRIFLTDRDFVNHIDGNKNHPDVKLLQNIFSQLRSSHV